MLIRTLSAVILFPIVVFVMINGGILLLSLLGLGALIGVYEFYRVMKIEKDILAIVGYLYTIGYFILLGTDYSVHALSFITSYIIVILVISVIKYPKYQIETLATAFLPLVYVAVMLSYIYIVRMSEHGQWTVWLIFICAWGADTCAYLAGNLFGKHKLSPKLSPNKTIEGSVGGILGAILIAVVYGILIHSKVNTEIPIAVIFGIIALGGSILSQFGDLAASGIKRIKNIKDYGNLIPGHGGIIDRMDSVFFTAPMVYFLMILLF
ncbi:MAG: putative rane protein [Clostridiales bacterium]|nr:putative rane protein [Clostridiales bacterium]